MSELQFKIVLDDAAYRRVSDELASVKNGATKAITAAINRTIRQVKVKVVDVVANESGIKKSVIRPKIKEQLANFRTLAGAVRVLNYNIPAHRISKTRRPNPKGDYSLTKVGQRITFSAKAFQNEKLGGGVAWFVRFGPKREMSQGRFKGKALRQRVYKLYALSPRIHMEKSGRIGEVTSVGQAIFMKNLESQVNRFLNRPKEATSGNPGT